MTALLLAFLAACAPDCVGEDCDEIPDAPWDPGEDTGWGDEYGYGDDTDEPDDTGDPPVEILSVRDCSVVLAHKLPAGASTLAAGGEFSAWTPTELTGPDADGLYRVDLGELAPGEYAYKLVVDGAWEGDPPASAYAKWVGDSENRSLRVGDCTLPLLQTVSASATAAGRVRATVQLASAADEVPVDPDQVRVTVGDLDVTPSVDAAAGTIDVDVADLPPGKHTVRVWAWDQAGRAAEGQPLFVPLWVEDEPFQWDDALLYFAFTDRFRNGDWGAEGTWDPVPDVAECANYTGGDFLGVIHAMEEGYFEDLGVNTLWLSPVYDNPEDAYIGMDGVHWFTGYHGYWPVEPTGVEDRFGDMGDGFWVSGEERLAELVEVAHARGIRVLFDLVLNHVHEDHTYLAEHPEWLGDGCVCGTPGCDWDSHAVDCWFMEYLPDLGYRNHDITMRVVEDTLALIEAYDVDALRIDAAKHMDHVIMRTLRHRIRDDYEAGGGAAFWLVGETFTGDRGLIMDYVSDHELSGQFDFPLYYGIRSTFTGGDSFSNLDASVGWSASAYGDAMMSPFLGNHDIERFATAYHGESGDCWSGWLEDPMADGGAAVTEAHLIDRTAMAFAFTLTQPGVPLVYYGDEIGLAGGGDPDNRRIMNFAPYLSANQAELLARVQAIGQAREASAALRRGERTTLWVDDDFYVYARDNGGGDAAIVAMNKSGSTRTESVSVSSLGLSGATLTDALGSGVSVTESGGSISLTLESWQVVILTR